MSADPAVAYCAELRLKLMGIPCTGKLECGRFKVFYPCTSINANYRCVWGQNHYLYLKKKTTNKQTKKST